MFTAILWDYDGTLANTPVKNIAVTRAVLGRLDPALLDPLPEALSSLAAYQAAVNALPPSATGEAEFYKDRIARLQ